MKKCKAIITLVLVTIMVTGLFGCKVTNVSPDSEITSESEEEVEKEPEPPAWTYDGSGTIKPKKKSETVSITADGQGKVEKIISSVTLSGIEGTQVVQDKTDLTDIKNRQGDEEFSLDGTALYWENKGENIEYEGRSTKELPVEIMISYSLDGEEVLPKDLAGKSGKVKIRIDYVNKTFRDIDIDGITYSVPVPFMAITALMFPENVLENIKADNCKITSMGSQDIIIATALPGLGKSLALADKDWTDEIEIPEYVEIEADATEFALDFSTTIIQNGMFEDVEDSDDLDELIDSMGDLTDATNSLINGAGELLDGQSTLSAGISTYLDGVAGLETGAGALVEGISTLDSQRGTLVDAAVAVDSGLSQLNTYMAQLEGMIPAEATEEEKQAMLGMIQSLESQIAGLAEGASGLSQGVQLYADGVSQLSAGAEQLRQGAQQLTSQNGNIRQGLSGVENGIAALRNGLIEYRDEGINEITSFVQDDIADLNRRVEALKQRDREYGNYSGIEDGVESEVVFMIETAEISK